MPNENMIELQNSQFVQTKVNNSLSSLYVDENGFLMCGEPNRFTSIVEGLIFIPINIHNGRKFDYTILFADGDGNPCNAYDSKFCKKDQFRYNEFN